MAEKSIVLTRLKDFKAEEIAKAIGITKTSAKRWKKGKIIHYRYHSRLDEFLKLDEGTTENYTKEILTEQGRIKVCKGCGKTYIARFQRTKACGSICRQKIKPVFEYKLKIKPQLHKEFIDDLPKDETRDLIRSETIKFLNKGSKIEKLKPEIEYFSFDEMTWEKL